MPRCQAVVALGMQGEVPDSQETPLDFAKFKELVGKASSWKEFQVSPYSAPSSTCH